MGKGGTHINGTALSKLWIKYGSNRGEWDSVNKKGNCIYIFCASVSICLFNFVHRASLNF